MTTNKPRNWNEVIQDLNKKDNPANKPLPAELPVLTELQILDICADCTMESKFSDEDCRYCHSKMETVNRLERNFCQSLYSQALKRIGELEAQLLSTIDTRNEFEFKVEDLTAQNKKLREKNRQLEQQHLNDNPVKSRYLQEPQK